MQATRFIPQALAPELLNLYHLARTALAGSDRALSMHSRMLWAVRMLQKAHPEVTVTGAYKDLCTLLHQD